MEVLGAVFGLFSVYQAAHENKWTWITGAISVILLFFVFYSAGLYASAVLQLFFLGFSVYGFQRWKIAPKSTTPNRGLLVLTVIAGTAFSYLITEQQYAVADCFILTSSIVATWLLTQKKIETWHLWIMVDAVSIVVYYKKELYYLSAEYLIFLGLAIYGLYNWKK